MLRKIEVHYLGRYRRELWFFDEIGYEIQPKKRPSVSPHDVFSKVIEILDENPSLEIHIEWDRQTYTPTSFKEYYEQCKKEDERRKPKPKASRAG